jgi:hypothetical protein
MRAGQGRFSRQWRRLESILVSLAAAGATLAREPARGLDTGMPHLRLFSSAPVVSVTQDGFATANSIYRVELIGGGPGEFAPFAEALLRELKPGETHAF